MCTCVQEAHGCEELEHLIHGGQRASTRLRGHSNALIDEVKEVGGAGRGGCSSGSRGTRREGRRRDAEARRDADRGGVLESVKKLK